MGNTLKQKREPRPYRTAKTSFLPEAKGSHTSDYGEVA